jgi:hypothetical protein
MSKRNSKDSIKNVSINGKSINLAIQNNFKPKSKPQTKRTNPALSIDS